MKEDIVPPPLPRQGEGGRGDEGLVCAIVLNWNGWADTVRCLAALHRSTYANLRVVVVDNGSTDGSVEHLAPFLDGTWGELIRSERNLGFTGGVNLGLRMALERGADLVLLLNNDATVAPECVATLVAALEARPDVGLAGPRIVWRDRPNLIWSAGMSVAWATATVHAHRDEPLDPASRSSRLDGVRVVQGLSACVLLVKRAVLEGIGPLDDRYFAYYEDFDLCLRARRAGDRSLYVGPAHAAHAGSATANRSGGRSQSALVNYYGARNILLFMATHAPPAVRPLTLTVLCARLLTAGARVLAGGLLLRRPGALARAAAIAAGILDAARGRFGARTLTPQPPLPTAGEGEQILTPQPLLLLDGREGAEGVVGTDADRDFSPLPRTRERAGPSNPRLGFEGPVSHGSGVRGLGGDG